MKVLLLLGACLLALVVYLNWTEQSPAVVQEQMAVTDISQEEPNNISNQDISSLVDKEVESQMAKVVEGQTSTLEPQASNLLQSTEELDEPIGTYEYNAVAPEDESVQHSTYEPMYVEQSDALAPEFGSENLSTDDSLPMQSEESSDGQSPEDSVNNP
jgi:hypothetical protein